LVGVEVVAVLEILEMRKVLIAISLGLGSLHPPSRVEGKADTTPRIPSQLKHTKILLHCA
jgi:hypothetical protein